MSYFGYHAFHGEFGIYAKYRLEERTAELTSTLASKRERREELEERIALLRDGTLEKDMLDEQTRRALNMSAPDELTIMRAFGKSN